MNKRLNILIVIMLMIVSLSSCGLISTGHFFSKEEANVNNIDFTIPIYNGLPYAIINENKPFFSKEDLNREAFEEYSELDSLGRCGVAFAKVGSETMPTVTRESIGQIRPTGWHTVKYNDLIEGNFLYNRCHLIAYQLTGENSNECNLITGTRWFNTKGMLPFENDVYNYIMATGNHVLYRVTPIFEADNLLASGVLMEAKSMEDNGQGICFNVYVYNMQPGIEIDYKTGDSKRTDSQTDDSENEATKGNNYIINISSRKFHHETCSIIKDMYEKNKLEFSGDRQELIDRGYEPCKRCNPQETVVIIKCITGYRYSITPWQS